MSVEKLFEGDQRLVALLEAIIEVTYERGKGLPIPSILGVFELAKQTIIEDNKDD